MEEETDFAKYITPTRFSNKQGIVLAIQLITLALLVVPTERVRAALAKLREAALHAQSVAVERLRMSPENLKPIDVRHDGGIVGLREVIEGKARLVGTEIGERAARLLMRLFPNGTAFVMLSYIEQWSATETHLTRIDEDGLATEIDEIAGPEFLPFIRDAHGEMGEALGLSGGGLTAPDTTAVHEANVRLAKAIANYGLAMVGTVDIDDPESIAAFKRAMYPLDAHRRAFFSRGPTKRDDGLSDDGSSDEPLLDTDVSPTDPIPPIPGEPSEA